MAWLTNKTTDPFENMSMNLLSRLLLNGPNAPMYKVLIDTNIGTPVRNRWCSSSITANALRYLRSRLRTVNRLRLWRQRGAVCHRVERNE